MGIFSSIKNAIFGEAQAADAPSPATATADAVLADSASTQVETAVQANVPAASAAAVDVSAILDAAVKATGQKLDWKHSIVDLLKALKIDSSLTARKELADELGFAGDMQDSAAMNIWLHKAVIKKLAENGGIVPADLVG